jgi:Cu(I)/Ag(I) efflux system membrane fusion protein
MPGDFGKMPKAWFKRKKKAVVYGLSNAQIESIKENFTIHQHSTYSGYISEIAATEGSYVMEGAAIIKLVALNTFGLKLK